MTQSQHTKRLITHDGSFHADDLFAFGVLKRIFPDHSLLRTRNQALFDAAGEDTIIFDVGGLYDPDRGRFDHHQPGRPMREEGLAYSAFGLIWKHYGEAFIATIDAYDAPTIAAIHASLDSGFVRDVDAVDNGHIQPGQEGALHPMSITSLLADMRPDFDDDDPRAMDDMFEPAADLALIFLVRKVQKAAARIRSRKIVEAAIAERSDPRWIELPRGMDYQGPILRAGKEAEDILFVINPGTKGDWQLNVVNVAHGSYTARKRLPESWAGLRDADLARVTGADDAIFCHLERFFACTGSRETIVKLLEEALAA